MSIVTAILGIVVFLLRDWYPQIVLLMLICATLGFIFFELAIGIGASRPRLASFLFQGSMLLPLALCALAAGGAIWLTAKIISWKGGTPTPPIEAVSAAITATILLISDKLRAFDWLRPSRFAKAATHWQYQEVFPQLYGGDSKEYKLAYEAIHRDALSDKQGEIKGWGFDATSRRLTLIRDASDSVP